MIRPNALCIVLLLTTQSFALVGCTRNVPKPAPARICASAMECMAVESRVDNSCKLPFGGSNSILYAATNIHPSRKIYATYEEKVRHLNSTRPDEKVSKMVAVETRTIEPLGCARTKGLIGDQIDEWSYTITAACFANECPSPPIAKPSANRDPRLSCEQLCERDDKSCLKVRIDPMDTSVSQKLDVFSRDLMSAIPPQRVKMSELIFLSNAYTGSSICVRGELELAGSGTPAYQFNNAGASCPIGFSVKSGYVSALEAFFPGDYSGQFENVAGKSWSLISEDESHSPTLVITESPAGNLVSEPLAAIQGSSRGQITFTGKKYYCAQVSWDR